VGKFPQWERKGEMINIYVIRIAIESVAEELQEAIDDNYKDLLIALNKLKQVEKRVNQEIKWERNS
jgi:hypothetical protein